MVFLQYKNSAGRLEYVAIDDISCIVEDIDRDTGISFGSLIYLKSDPERPLGTLPDNPSIIIGGATFPL